MCSWQSPKPCLVRDAAFGAVAVAILDRPILAAVPLRQVLAVEQHDRVGRRFVASPGSITGGSGQTMPLLYSSTQAHTVMAAAEKRKIVTTITKGEKRRDIADPPKGREVNPLSFAAPSGKTSRVPNRILSPLAPEYRGEGVIIDGGRRTAYAKSRFTSAIRNHEDSMNTREAISAAMDLSLMVLKKYFGDMTDQELLRRPGQGCNHLAWQLGHLISSECGLLDSLSPRAALNCPPVSKRSTTRPRPAAMIRPNSARSRVPRSARQGACRLAESTEHHDRRRSGQTECRAFPQDVSDRGAHLDADRHASAHARRPVRAGPPSVGKTRGHLRRRGNRHEKPRRRTRRRICHGPRGETIRPR